MGGGDGGCVLEQAASGRGGGGTSRVVRGAGGSQEGDAQHRGERRPGPSRRRHIRRRRRWGGTEGPKEIPRRRVACQVCAPGVCACGFKLYRMDIVRTRSNSVESVDIKQCKSANSPNLYSTLSPRNCRAIPTRKCYTGQRLRTRAPSRLCVRVRTWPRDCRAVRHVTRHRSLSFRRGVQSRVKVGDVSEIRSYAAAARSRAITHRGKRSWRVMFPGALA